MPSVDAPGVANSLGLLVLSGIAVSTLGVGLYRILLRLIQTPAVIMADGLDLFVNLPLRPALHVPL